MSSKSGQTRSFEYDADQQLVRRSYPDGTEHRFSYYDSRNRLTLLESRDVASTVVQRYAYTLSPTGRRTQIEEANGTVRAYIYDALYRLTQDRVTDPAGGLKYQRDFVYDAVGNRLTQTLEEGAGPSAVSSSYDERDRLLTAGADTYSWDSNGSLTSRVGDTLTWDFDQRLKTIDLIRDVLDYLELGRRILAALSSSTPEGALAALISAFAGELSPEHTSTFAGSFKKAVDAIGDHWSDMTRRIASHADTIAAEAGPEVLRRIPKYTKLQLEGRIKYVYYLPTGPGEELEIS